MFFSMVLAWVNIWYVPLACRQKRRNGAKYARNQYASHTSKAKPITRFKIIGSSLTCEGI
jgi:hypothetical protein